jgi:cobalt/nickel transport system permease protein
MHLLLDDYALRSPLRYKNNRLKLGLVGAALMVGVFSTSPVAPLFIALTMSLATVLLGKAPAKFYAQLVMVPLVFALIGAAIIAFFFGGGAEVFSLTAFGYRLAANAEGVNLALLVMARTVSGMCCLFFLALTTPMVELFAELKAARMPVAFMELSMMIYRYIFLFLEEAMQMREAQITRLGYQGFRGSIQSFSMLASTLFIRTWEQGEKLYAAMDARCYDGKLFIFEEKRAARASEVAAVSIYIGLIMTLAYLTREVSLL